jgi:hypothetical protein
LCWFQIWNFSFCVHGFDLSPIFVLGGFPFGFLSRALRPGPFWCSSARACALLSRRRPDSTSRHARVYSLGFSRSAVLRRHSQFPESSFARVLVTRRRSFDFFSVVCAFSSRQCTAISVFVVSLPSHAAAAAQKAKFLHRDFRTAFSRRAPLLSLPCSSRTGFCVAAVSRFS